MNLTWETKKVQIQSSEYPWSGTHESYLELLDFVPPNKLRYELIENHPIHLQVYNDLEHQWLNVPVGHWLVKGLKGEFYPCEAGAMEMKYKIIDPILTVDALKEGLKGLPDSYDDPRIDNACHVLRDILDLIQKNGAVSLAQIEKIVEESTEFPDFWDENREW